LAQLEDLDGEIEIDQPAVLGPLRAATASDGEAVDHNVRAAQAILLTDEHLAVTTSR
jgi:hypothetical protein